VQRVKRARVTVADGDVARIGPGALILVAAARDDTPADIEYLARKVARLRIFDDADGRLNLDIRAVEGSFLVVSQFTLYGDCRKGNRPSYVDAAAPEAGRRGYEVFVERLRALGHEVQTGHYRSSMEVELVNDGPVTLILESRGRTAS